MAILRIVDIRYVVDVVRRREVRWGTCVRMLVIEIRVRVSCITH